MINTATVIDVGGTHMRWGRWSREGGLINKQSMPTPTFRRNASLSVTQLQALLVETICDIPPRERGTVAGISFGAAMNHLNGTVYASAPLWGSHEAPFDILGALSSKRTDVVWHIVNDVTAALLHAASLPLCAEDQKVMLVTISTGIAARTIYRKNQKIPFDASGLQGEIGHLPASASICGESVALDCDCGEPGHLASYASGPGIARMAELICKRHPELWRVSELGQRVAKGVSFEDAFKSAVIDQDSVAVALLKDVTAPVADVLRTALCLEPDIDRIILTGGVAISLGEHYRESIISHLTDKGIYLTSKYHPEWVNERVTVLEADCLIGAGTAALMEKRV